MTCKRLCLEKPVAEDKHQRRYDTYRIQMRVLAIPEGAVEGIFLRAWRLTHSPITRKERIHSGRQRKA